MYVLTHWYLLLNLKTIDIIFLLYLHEVACSVLYVKI